MHKVVRGVDVFKVGKEQLWRWCAWQQYSACEPTLSCQVYSLRKGAYVVVLNAAIFGQMSSVPVVWEVCRSLRDAVGLVRDFVETDNELIYDNLRTHIVDDYEIWHIVDDEQLWGQWCMRAENARRLAGCTVLVERVRCLGPSKYAGHKDGFTLPVTRYEDAEDMLRGMGYRFESIHQQTRHDVGGVAHDTCFEVWTRYRVVSSRSVNGLGIDTCETDYMRVRPCPLSSRCDECTFWMVCTEGPY